MIEAIATIIKNARRICILTGAGVSAESGIATFREAQTGLWAKFDPHKLASIEGFLQDPLRVWQWYQWRREMNRDKQPNPAHQAIVTWQKHSDICGQQIRLITQNVDGLHTRAGSEAVIEIHGNLWRNHCFDCHAEHLEDTNTLMHIPKCLRCGGNVRPSVVWFGETLPEQAWANAEDAAYSGDVFLSIGTSSQVYPAASLAMLAKSRGATLIEINPEPTQNPYIDYQLAEKAGTALPALLNALIY